MCGNRKKLAVRQIALSTDEPTPIYKGYGIVLINQGTHRLKIGNNLVLIPGEQWRAATDSNTWIEEIPSLSFDATESKTYQSVSKEDLPDFLTKKGKLVIVQYLQEV